jgi:primary-amine oxidase
MAHHPLDPLAEDEFRATAAILRRDRSLDGSWRFAGIELLEPAKAEVKAHRPGDDVPRAAQAVLWHRGTNEAVEAVVDLTGDRVVSWTTVPGATPNFTVDEWHEVDEAMRAHPEVVAALAERGISDMSLVLVDAWTYGRALMPPQWADRRLGWCDIWVRATPRGNPYAHPVPGLKLVVDMNTVELLDIERGPDPGMPDVAGEYAPGVRRGEQRADLAPLHITQPEGVSFTVDGHELRWQKWSIRVGFNHREGMTLHTVSHDGREVAHRMSFAEMIVPYRDPSFEHVRRTAYDIGEWGLGFMTTSLELGCDCLGEITYLDATLHDSHGEPFTITNAICIHEEDNAVLWKHVDGETGAEVRRMRRFVVSFHATVANYEYLVYWRFYQDGSIECEVRATGIMVTTPYDVEAGAPATGTRVDRATYAPIHQHFIVARLDLDVDGPTQTVLEVDSEVLPVSADNPHGLAVRTVATPVRSESEAGRDFDWGRQRGWKVINPRATNALGDHPAYKLVPSASIPVLMEPGTPQFERAPVLGHTVWVTANHPDQRWPAGPHPTQSTTDVGGMSEWVADDEPLEDADVVLWYVFGIHHVPRPEDWPVMPADTVSWWLKPFGFFDENPALDVPPSPRGAASCCGEGGCTCH